MSGNFSQIASGSRINPPNRRARGRHLSNWSDSLMSVRFMFLSGGVPTQYKFSNSFGVEEILVFSQDYPVLFRAFEFDGTKSGGVPLRAPLAEANNFQNYYFLSTGNALYTTTQAMPLGEKEAAWGTTRTGKVEVSGYPFVLFSYIDLISNYDLEADLVANCAIPAGRATRHTENVNPPVSAVFTDQFPCFLLETDYTYAMAAAGNIHTVTHVAGPITTTTRLVICGLFAEIAIQE